MKLKLTLEHIQHITAMTVDFDLEHQSLACIVGRNGCGKTTLIRALRNLLDATTFSETAAPNIFNTHSRIAYEINEESLEYRYNVKFNVLDSKQTFEQKSAILVELPLPSGERFKYFQTLGSIDDELRTKITEKDYEPAKELIALYQNLYHLSPASNRFSQLKKVNIKGEDYYFILQPEDYYIRQDYFSSGEFFVLELYRLANKPNKLIVIDELDISLDAAAQVKLLELLRPILERSQSKLLFTTHSLALMKSLNEGELYFMENLDGEVSIEPRSYAFIKATLFGFTGWDRIILVEDDMTKRYLEWLLKDEAKLPSYNIIYIGGHQGVIDLYKRNQTENYFNVSAKNVTCCLDGDQSGVEKYQSLGVFFLPFESVEKRLLALHDSGQLPLMLVNHQRFNNASKRAKNITEQLTKFNDGKPLITLPQVFEVLMDSETESFKSYKSEMLKFLKC